MKSLPRWVSFVVQAGGAGLVMFGVYRAFDHGDIFWSVVSGAGVYYAGWFLRHKQRLLAGD